MNNLPIINIFHALIIAPFLFYIGYQNNYGHQKPGKKIYDILMILAALAFVYHSYRIITRF